MSGSVTRTDELLMLLNRAAAEETDEKEVLLNVEEPRQGRSSFSLADPEQAEPDTFLQVGPRLRGALILSVCMIRLNRGKPCARCNLPELESKFDRQQV